MPIPEEIKEYLADVRIETNEAGNPTHIFVNGVDLGKLVTRLEYIHDRNSGGIPQLNLSMNVYSFVVGSPAAVKTRVRLPQEYVDFVMKEQNKTKNF